jgi:GMP synthase (glutamine-hydrolysing)
MTKDCIAILDFGSQYTHLIARRIRELKVYSEILPYNTTINRLKSIKPKGIILSGGPSSVTTKKSPKCDRFILDMGIPILGICYGAQLIAEFQGGKVAKARAREYGKSILSIVKKDRLLGNLLPSEIVWMSHGDKITRLPKGFAKTACTPNARIAAMSHPGKNIFGVQFHPEVVHTPHGMNLLRNFVFDIAGCRKTWSMHSFVDNAIEDLRKQLKDEKVICGLSGGVDSSVLAVLLHKAIGKNLTAMFIDNGLLRKDEAALVKTRFKKNYRINLKCVNASEIFLKRLHSVKDPERKRRIIGKTFIEIFEKQAKKLGRISFLAQGTLYPDVIESRSVLGGPSAVIKTHHNVGGLPSRMRFKLVEPLKDLFKDEVRLLGKELGMSDELVFRHPFPGPGLAVRIIGVITEKRLNILKQADWILIDEIKKAGLYNKLWQVFCVLLPIRTVGVMGDERTYENVVSVRAVTSDDAMTADWADIPYATLQAISNRIINEVEGINRVVYDISSKPPSTIEWE